MNSDNAGQRSCSCIDYNVGMRPALMGVQGSSMEKLCATACGRTGLRPRFMPPDQGGKLNVSFKKNSRRVTPCDLDPRNRLFEYKAPYEPFDKRRHAVISFIYCLVSIVTAYSASDRDRNNPGKLRLELRELSPFEVFGI